MYSRGEALASVLDEKGINAILVNPFFINKLDKATLDNLSENHQVVVTIKDSNLDDGFGQKVASYLGKTDTKVLNFGAMTEFTDSVPMDELYNCYPLTIKLMAADVLELTKKDSNGGFGQKNLLKIINKDKTHGFHEFFVILITDKTVSFAIIELNNVRKG